jgi:hypothetical protein
MSGITKFFTKVGNWISYRFSFLDDPEVIEHAKRQAEQERIEREMAKAAAEAKAASEQAVTEVKDKAKKVANIAKKSTFSSVQGNFSNVSTIILKIFWYLIPIFIILYAGSITSNWLIGYSAAMRLFAFSMLVFLYVKVPLATTAFSILYILKFIFYNQLFMKEIAPYYSWLPLLEYHDSQWKRYVPFFWKSTPLSKLKQKVVRELYENAFVINMNTGTVPPKPYEDALAVCIEVGRLFGKQGFSRTVAAIKCAEVQLTSIEANAAGLPHGELERRVEPMMKAEAAAHAPTAQTAPGEVLAPQAAPQAPGQQPAQQPAQ